MTTSIEDSTCPQAAAHGGTPYIIQYISGMTAGAMTNSSRGFCADVRTSLVPFSGAPKKKVLTTLAAGP